MQNFDDDMGELVRKASSDIRLRPSDDDWDKIQKRILPGGSLLPVPEINIYHRNTYRQLMIVFFIFGIAISGTADLSDQKAKGIEFGQQPANPQSDGSMRKPAIEYDQTGKKSKPGYDFSSFIPTVSKDHRITDHLKLKSYSMLSPLGGERHIQIDFQAEFQTVKTMIEFKQGLETLPPDERQTEGRYPVEEKGIYGGIISGPQFNHTKQKGFGHAGLSSGLIAGFHLNKKLSVEAGLIVSDKQFSSSGDYFDMSKISASMPSGMKLIQVQSKTTVLEIPLGFKYDLFKTGKGKLFATGGLSSFIITRESNQYKASFNGNEETLNGNYSMHQNYFAAAANIGAGYDWKAGKFLNLRLEPYLQIPLKTIGMGSMHVVSTGVYFGITFPIIK